MTFTFIRYHHRHHYHLQKFQNIVCYCLSLIRRVHRLIILISKHRMLLFIPMLLYSAASSVDFKTSYVTVYRKMANIRMFVCRISKHRMLLFIRTIWKMRCASTYFKTSYVIVYLSELIKIGRISWHFKTSYVTVYQYFQRNHIIYIEFQNIVCYCLSSGLVLPPTSVT